MKKIPRLGFSLIELSIVILVIGILVVGVTKGSRIISASKLKSAIALTKSSPINAFEGLALWLETTSERSLQNSANSYDITDGNNIKSWIDTNQTSSGFIATEPTNMPIYKKDGIGNLPTLFFDAASNGSSGDSLTIPYNSILNGETFTTFVVTQPLEVTNNWGAVIMTRNWNSPQRGGYNLYKDNSNTNWQFWSSNPGTGGSLLNQVITSSLTFNQPVILTLNRNYSFVEIYKNGTLASRAANTTFIRNSAMYFTIGTPNYWGGAPKFYYDGYISEIICFSRSLKQFERKGVEQYLSQKYGIKIS
jgi:prepilin-type N-terminal cleavage/methylation domain-containing protein